MTVPPDAVRAPTPVSATVQPRRILALDGGGIRCLIGIEVLLAMEEALAQRHGDPDYRLYRHFDLVAGTSGGAIVGAAVALGLPMREIRDFVVANARNMFRPAAWYRMHKALYDPSHLEQNMKDWFGADTRLGSDRLRTQLLLVMRNFSTDSPWLVSNNPNAPYNDRTRDDCNLDLKLWQLARASSAAPGYYAPETIIFGRERPYEFIFVDGGLTGFLNPAFKAFQYATTGPYGLNWSTGEDRLTLVSVGAGDGRFKRVGVRAGDVHIMRAARAFPDAMLNATIREQDLLCRTFGRCLTGDPIDREVGDLKVAPTALQQRLFAYHRLNIPLTPEGLQSIGCGHIRPKDVIKIDSVEFVDQISEVGRALGRKLAGTVLDT